MQPVLPASSLAMRGRAPLVAALLLGLLAAGAAAMAGNLDTASTAVLAGMALCLTGALLLRTSRRLLYVTVASTALGFSVNMQKTFLPITGVDLQRVGGGGGITVSICTLSAIMMLALFAHQAKMGERPRWLAFEPTLTLAPCLFALAGLASLVNAQTPAWTWYELYREAMLFLVFVAVMNLQGQYLKWFIQCFTASVILQGGIAILQVGLQANLGLSLFGENQLVNESIDFRETIRATGTIGHPNILAYFFEITLPLMLAMTLASRGWIRLLYLAAFGAGTLGMLGTLSRGAWLTLPVTLPLVFGLVQGFRIRSARGRLLGLAGVACGFAALHSVGPEVMTRMFADDGGSADRRIPLDLAAWSIVEQFPVFGVGLNNFAEAFTRFDRTGFGRWPNAISHVVHNLYLFVWVEVGTVGLACFLWYFASAFLTSARIARRAGSWDRAIAIGASAGLLAQLIHGLFDPGFRLSLAISQLIAAQIGLIAATRLQQRMPA